MYCMRLLSLLRLLLLASPLPLCCLAFVLLSLFTNPTYAEGSKDFYPAGAQGNRAFLYANVDATNYTDRFPFKTRGAHFVYAKAGETIAVASSAIGVNNGRIVVTSPDGSSTTYNVNNNVGLIPNRAAELQGPGLGYTPISILVAAAREGVWRVEFVAPVGSANSSDITPPDVLANGNWTQQTATNSNYIAAWDVSVKNAGGAWLTGRVYANVLNLGIYNNLTGSNKGFQVTNFVLTEDGRAYRIQSNGNNGHAFTFFSNNNGFAINGVPTYKSLNASNAAALTGLHDPRGLDNALNKTHKIFYNRPNVDLPETSKAFITAIDQTTWLKRTAVLPVITNLKILGVEGTEGKVSYKGAKITFNASASGSYKITIPMANGADRIINGAAIQGYNEVFWDVKDGNGNLLPPGPITPLVETFLRSAEVHFPYIDMEINPQGIIIELTENNTSYNVDPSKINPSEYSDIVYWDDSNITNAGVPGRNSSNPVVNLTGVSSRSNGHKFGAYSTNNQFGDARSMDTWTYIESGKMTQLVNIEIRHADLKIESINPDLSQYFSNRTITYTIKVQNDGPSAADGAKLDIALPAGLTISSVNLSNQSAGVVLNSSSNTAQSYVASLNLPNQATLDVVIVATFTGSYNQIFANTKASILRPADLSDPDATSNGASGPMDADVECLNGAPSGVGLCNNIKYNTVNGQDLCQGTAIIPVSYALSADGTQLEHSALPTALTPQDASGNRTIAGVIAAPGIHSFYIKTQNTKRTQTNAIVRSVEAPDATIEGPLNVCVGATDNPVITFKGSGSSDGYEFSYQLNSGNVQTVTIIAGVADATVAIPLTNAGQLTYKLIAVKNLATGCSQTKNLSVVVDIQPKPTKAHIQLNN
ncbi:MAG: DUF11 domain-containing protein [Sphingobacteriaceae bacterium]|nr:MAG: DUF11 domain-containing protein [Sphingobacteriaceae bacterium]